MGSADGRALPSCAAAETPQNMDYGNLHEANPPKQTADEKFNEGIAVLHGTGSKKIDKGYATVCIVEARDRGSDVARGMCLLNGWNCEKNLSEAISYFRKAASIGNVHGVHGLAVCLLPGEENLLEDPKEAIRLLRIAAEKNHSRAQCELGHCYRHGIGVEANIKQAVFYYRLSATSGDSRGLCCLGGETQSR